MSRLQGALLKLLLRIIHWTHDNVFEVYGDVTSMKVLIKRSFSLHINCTALAEQHINPNIVRFDGRLFERLLRWNFLSDAFRKLHSCVLRRINLFHSRLQLLIRNLIFLLFTLLFLLLASTKNIWHFLWSVRQIVLAERLFKAARRRRVSHRSSPFTHQNEHKLSGVTLCFLCGFIF